MTFAERPGDGDHCVAAALEPSRWPDTLARLADLTGADHAQLIGFGPDYSVGFNWISGGAADMVEAFDPVPPAYNFRVAAARLFPGESILHERHYAAAIPRLPSTDYVALAEQWGIRFGCQTDLRNQPDGVIGLALLASKPTTASARAMFDRARIDVAAAISLQIALEQEGYRLIAGTFEAMAGACFVLDRGMRVRALTPVAEALVRDGVFRLSEGRLTTAPGRNGRNFDRAIASIGVGERSSQHVILPPQGDAGAVGIAVHRLPRREWDLGYSPFAIVTVTADRRERGDGAATLRDAFGLTTAEAEIAMLIGAGRERADICTARGISPETLRSHLRAIFAKLGVRREAQLIHLLARIGA